jgi:dihydroorotate dehydrogenase electron transfer subunit
MAPNLRMLKVAEHISESPSVKTIRFEEPIDGIPGQFVMVWVPGVDEFPMSVSYFGERPGMTYQVLGEGTEALASTPVGGRVGIRGPYGRGFEIKGKKVMVVAGGMGIAPTAPLVERATSTGVAVRLALGARTASELVFERRCEDAGATVSVSTDDGTKGFAGLVTSLAESIMDKERHDSVYVCGPEKMISSMVASCRTKGLPMQASVERIMKCGIGICDSCALDGKHVCKDGPVFDLQELERFAEFGKTKLDRTGRRTDI